MNGKRGLSDFESCVNSCSLPSSASGAPVRTYVWTKETYADVLNCNSSSPFTNKIYRLLAMNLPLVLLGIRLPLTILNSTQKLLLMIQHFHHKDWKIFP